MTWSVWVIKRAACRGAITCCPHNCPGLCQHGNPNQPSCMGKLTHTQTGHQIQVNILIDSGNSVDHCAAITLSSAACLNLSLQLCNMATIAADHSHSMVPCGQACNLGLRFASQHQPTLLHNVLVLHNLSGDINLGFKFLQRNQS